jgi:hypothetical protein
VAQNNIIVNIELDQNNWDSSQGEVVHIILGSVWDELHTKIQNLQW